MRSPILLACILITTLLSACGPAPASPVTGTPTSIFPTNTHASALSPTATLSPTPSATATLAPIGTPTSTFTPTPAAITQENARTLHRVARYPLPQRGLLTDADYSSTGDMVLASTSIGTYILSASSLEQLNFIPGLSLVSRLDSGKWLARSSSQEGYIILDEKDGGLTRADELLGESDWDLISSNLETAVRKIDEDELEIIRLKTGEHAAINLKKIGIYFKDMQMLVLSPDGKVLIVKEQADKRFLAYLGIQTDTLKVAFNLKVVFSDPVFSSDSQFMITTDSGGIKVLKAKNGIQVNRFANSFTTNPTPETRAYYYAHTFSWFPDSQNVGVIYCAENQSCELYLWNMATGLPGTIVKRLPANVSGLDFTKGGASFLTASYDGFLTTWSLEDQTELARSLPFDRTELTLSSDGRFAAAVRGNQVEILEVETGKLIKTIGDYPNLKALIIDAFSEKSLLISGMDKTGSFADLWDLASGELRRKFRPLPWFSPYASSGYCVLTLQENRIACGGNPLQVFDVQTGALLYSNKGVEIWSLSPDGNTLASCSGNYINEPPWWIPGDRIFLQNVATNSPQPSGDLEAPGGKVCGPISFSPNGKYLSAQSGHIWKLDDRVLMASHTQDGNAPVQFNADGTLMVSGKRVVNPETGEVLAELAVEGQVESLGFGNDGFSLILSTAQGVEVWKAGG